MRVEHEYQRRGAWAYLAALDVHRAHVVGRCEAQTLPSPRRAGHDCRPVPARYAGTLDPAPAEVTEGGTSSSAQPRHSNLAPAKRHLTGHAPATPRRPLDLMAPLRTAQVFSIPLHHRLQDLHPGLDPQAMERFPDTVQNAEHRQRQHPGGDRGQRVLVQRVGGRRPRAGPAPWPPVRAPSPPQGPRRRGRWRPAAAPAAARPARSAPPPRRRRPGNTPAPSIAVHRIACFAALTGHSSPRHPQRCGAPERWGNESVGPYHDRPRQWQPQGPVTPSCRDVRIAGPIERGLINRLIG